MVEARTIYHAEQTMAIFSHSTARPDGNDVHLLYYLSLHTQASPASHMIYEHVHGHLDVLHVLGNGAIQGSTNCFL